MAFGKKNKKEEAPAKPAPTKILPQNSMDYKQAEAIAQEAETQYPGHPEMHPQYAQAKMTLDKMTHNAGNISDSDMDDDDIEARALAENQFAAQETENPTDVVAKTDRTDEEVEEKAIEENKAAAEEIKKKEAEQAAAAQDTEDAPGNTGNAEKDAKTVIEQAGIPKGDKNNRHYKATKSIWSAYYDGDFGEPGSKEAKEVAWYYTIDSLAKLGNKIGKNIRNVGAAWSGGTIDTSEDEKSAWQEHQDSLRKESTDITKEGMGGAASRQKVAENLRNEAMAMANDKNATVKDLIDKYAQKMEEAGNPVSEQMYANLVANLAGAGMSTKDSLMSLSAGGIDTVLKFFGL